MSDEPVDVSGFIEGQAVELTPDNDELGVLCFGEQWPAMKARLERWRTQPRPDFVVRVTRVRTAEEARRDRTVNALDRYFAEQPKRRKRPRFR